MSRSLRDTAYKAIYAKEGYIKRHMKEPTVQEIAEEIGIAKEEIVYALDAIQMPMSLHEPVYSDGQDALFVMDQVSDKKNKEENWIEELSLEACDGTTELKVSDILSHFVFLKERRRWKLQSRSIFRRLR